MSHATKFASPKSNEGGGPCPPPSFDRRRLKSDEAYWSGVAVVAIVSVTGAVLLKKIVLRVSVAK